MNLTLRPYQQQAVSDVHSAFVAGKRSPLVVLATGGGKTIIFSHLARLVSAKNKRVLILVHRVELIRQTIDKIGSCGVISPHYRPDTLHPIQVASVQTLVKRLHKYSGFDLIIIDECHHAISGSQYDTILKHYGSRSIGFTATPIRLDGTALDLFDEMIIGPSTRQLVEMGNLVRPTVYAPQLVSTDGLHKRMGDYVISEIEALMDKPAITGDAISHWKKHASGLKTVTFCTTIKHAKHVADQFTQAGIPTLSIDGTMDDDQRQDILQKLRNGEILNLTSVNLIGEGFDLPDISCAVLLRPTDSESLYIQQVGRALRPAEGKDKAIILDHVGNTIKHGHPIAEREWTLTGKKRKERQETISVKQCEKCFFVYEPAPACPMCGHVNAFKRQEIKLKSGELQAMKEQEKFERKKLRIEQGKLKTLDELKAFAKAHGRHPKWAEYVFNARQKK